MYDSDAIGFQEGKKESFYYVREQIFKHSATDRFLTELINQYNHIEEPILISARVLTLKKL